MSRSCSRTSDTLPCEPGEHRARLGRRGHFLDGRHLEAPFLVDLAEPVGLDDAHERNTAMGSTRSAFRTDTKEAVRHMATVKASIPATSGGGTTITTPVRTE